MTIQVSVLAHNPELRKRVAILEDKSFPAFLNEEPIWLRVQEDIFREFADYHLFLIDSDSNETMGVIINVPLCWNGRPEDLPTYNGLLTRCLDEHRAGKPPTALCSILAAVAPNYQNKGAFKKLFAETAALLDKHDLQHFLFFVRPSIKQFYPNFDIADFLKWRFPNGELLDTWMQSFEQQGYTFLGIIRDSITVTAPTDQWTKWTGMQFPVSGEFVIPGGHSLLKVDRTTGDARYAEDHVWYSILSRDP